MKIKIWIWVFLGVGLWAPGRVAQGQALNADAVFQPATLGEGKRALSRLIRPPDLSSGTRVEQSCQVLISSNHGMAKLQCKKTTDANRALHVAIESAAKFVNFRAARLFDDPITVWIPFRVVAHGADAGTALTLFTGPENSDVSWPQMQYQRFEARCGDEKDVAARINLSADGSATLEAMQEKPIADDCLASVREYIAQMQFIPARQDGQWVEQQVDILLYDPAAWRKKNRWEAFLIL